jgi:hypothetical protein
MSKYDAKKQLKCSFCGKPQDQVRRLVAGPSVYICDECIELCCVIYILLNYCIFKHKINSFFHFYILCHKEKVFRIHCLL